ncbi:hypothetical protein BJF78_06900 [Pseudonocardia sp. CNS-139]|nr:hypothetical protein BJF78_06900 [Pseudonocardia sp. CNS-139]
MHEDWHSSGTGKSADDGDDFMRPLDDFEGMRCWGELWARPGLGARDRSLVSIAVLAAQARFDELRTHVRGAVTSGCTVEEIQETLLQAGTHSSRDVVHQSFRVARAALSQPVRRFPARQRLAS